MLSLEFSGDHQRPSGARPGWRETWWLMAERWFRGGMSLQVAFYGARRLNATMPLARLHVSDRGILAGDDDDRDP